MLKKIFFRLLLMFPFVGLILLGLGCKGPSAPEIAATKPREIEWWIVYDDYEALQSIVEKYVAERPYLTITIKQIRPDELYTRLVEALAEDKGPDIVSVRNNAVRGLKSKLAPMPATFQDATVRVERGTVSTKTVVTPLQKRALSPLQIEQEYVRAVKNDVIEDNLVYGLPLSLDTMGIFYNKDLLDRARIAEPPKTWDELQKVMEQLTKFNKDGQIIQSGAALGTGNNIASFDDMLFLLLKQSGLEMMGRDGRPVFHQFNDRGDFGSGSPTMQVINFYTGFANKDRKTYSWNETMGDALEGFSNGSVAFFFGYSYHVAAIKAQAPQLNFGVIPLLQINPDNPVNAANYWVQTVTAKSKNKEAAWALLDYVAHSAATKEYLDATNRPSALRTYVSGQLENTEIAPFASQVLVADSWYHGANYDIARRALADMLHEWLLPVPENEDALEWQQKILNRAASKIEQSL